MRCHVNFAEFGALAGCEHAFVNNSCPPFPIWTTDGKGVLVALRFGVSFVIESRKRARPGSTLSSALPPEYLSRVAWTPRQHLLDLRYEESSRDTASTQVKQRGQ